MLTARCTGEGAGDPLEAVPREPRQAGPEQVQSRPFPPHVLCAWPGAGSRQAGSSRSELPSTKPWSVPHSGLTTTSQTLDPRPETLDPKP
eukprot:1343790-Rhodomonas_salina.2